MKKVYIETYGCQMNVADTEVVFSILEKHGYGRTQEMDEADVIMANTCSIRDNAEQRILGRIEQFILQRRHRDVIIGILGCMAERMKEQLLSSGKVDLVAGHLQASSGAAGGRRGRTSSDRRNSLSRRDLRGHSSCQDR